MDAESPAAARNSFDVDRVVEIARIIRIDRDDELLAQILATFEHLLARLSPEFVCASSRTSLGNSVGRWYFRMIDSMSTPGAELGPSTSMISPFGIDVARFPRFQPDDDFVAALRGLRERRLRRNLDVNVVDDARIVRHDVEKIFRLLQSSDDRVVRAFQDANHAAFRRDPGRSSRANSVHRG